MESDDSDNNEGESITSSWERQGRSWNRSVPTADSSPAAAIPAAVTQASKRALKKASKRLKARAKAKERSAKRQKLKFAGNAGSAAAAPLDPQVLLRGRVEARAAGDWVKADQFRDQLEGLGFAVQEEKGGTSRLINLAAAERRKSKKLFKHKQREKEAGAAKVKRQAVRAQKETERLRKEAKMKAKRAKREAKKEAGSKEHEPEREQTELRMGVSIEDLVVGRGKMAEDRCKVKVQYVGKLEDGGVFDRSGRKPFAFRLGRGEVIKGWDIGVMGMKVGGKRRIVCPPKAAYGSRAMPGGGGKVDIPANATLIFEVTLTHTT